MFIDLLSLKIYIWWITKTTCRMWFFAMPYS